MVAMERVPQLGTINVLVVKILSYESIRSIIDVSKINMTTSIWTRKFYDHKKCFKKILCTAFFHPESTIERAISGAEKRKKSFLLLLSFSATLIPCSAQTVVETKVASCARAPSLRQLRWRANVNITGWVNLAPTLEGGWGPLGQMRNSHRCFQRNVSRFVKRINRYDHMRGFLFSDVRLTSSTIYEQ